MSAIGFEFPIDGSGQWDGFNDPGIEHFTGNRLQHLGREVPQNTIDAKRGDPARIEVRLIRVPAASLPGRDQLAEAVARCRVATGNDWSDKAAKFFEEATRLLAANELAVLQIRDRNTTGLVGPCVNGTPFFAMMKASGQSQKPGTSTGSYGIGKFAPFAVSELRTVFVSTVWADQADTLHHYVQGKAVLMSHLDEAGQTRRGTGFWGVVDQCQPVTALTDDIPSWLRMGDAGGRLAGQCGTMLSIVGFAAAKGWQRTLAANIAENFFGAIHRGELEVEIADGPTITSASLDEVLADRAIGQSVADQAGEPERFANVASYLRAIKGGDEVQTVRTENYHLGLCELRILVGENLPKRVAVLRNGMLITEGLPGLKRFSEFKEFAAVLECTADKGLALLRAMEPPRHDAFEPDRLPPDRRSQGRTALRELAEWVRKMLVRHAKDELAEEIDLDEMADYFGDEEEDGDGRPREENPGGKIVFRARAVKAKGAASRALVGASSEPEPDDDGNGADAPGDVGGEPGGNRPDRPSGERGGEIPKGDNGAAPAARTQHSGLALADVRAVPLGPTRRRVAFTPNETGVLVVELQDSGTDTNYALAVAASSAGDIVAGRISGVEAQAGVRMMLDVELADAFEGTLRVVANAV